MINPKQYALMNEYFWLDVGLIILSVAGTVQVQVEVLVAWFPVRLKMRLFGRPGW